jgi:hypothetical protein
LNIQFTTPHQYVFIHQHVQHLLLVWEKEKRQDIYIIETETPDTITLRYPGETYRELILDELGSYFFQVLLSENEVEIPVILGATFDFEKQLIGMYYQKSQPTETPYFFFLYEGELGDIAAEVYPQVIQQFRMEFPEYTIS